MRLRSIDVQMLRILEEMSAGRQETVADLRASDQVTMENLASALCFRSFDVAEPWS